MYMSSVKNLTLELEHITWCLPAGDSNSFPISVTLSIHWVLLAERLPYLQLSFWDFFWLLERALVTYVLHRPVPPSAARLNLKVCKFKCGGEEL